MDKRMDFSEKTSMKNTIASLEPNKDIFVRRVASSGLVLKFKVDNKYGAALPSTHTISSEVMMSGGKQNVSKLLANETNCSLNAIPVLEQSNISAAEATRSNNRISLPNNANVALPHEIVHTCDECGKKFKEISSLHGHKGVHRREEYKRKRIMLEQQAIAVVRLAAKILMELYRSDEETDETREVAGILVTLAQNSCKDSTVHVSSSASVATACFVCTTCKEVFSSYHALGCHMSIHNNKPTTKNSLLEDGGNSSGSREESTWKHVCDKCNKRFPSGQVLGGHKRKHWWEEHYYKMAQLEEDRNVKPRLLPILPHHETKRSGLVVVPTDENIQPAGTGLAVAAHIPSDGVQPQQAMSLGRSD